jgi:hypothetical protein
LLVTEDKPSVWLTFAQSPFTHNMILVMANRGPNSSAASFKGSSASSGALSWRCVGLSPEAKQVADHAMLCQIGQMVHQPRHPHLQ